MRNARSRLWFWEEINSRSFSFSTAMSEIVSYCLVYHYLLSQTSQVQSFMTLTLHIKSVCIMLGLIGKTIKFETNCYSSIKHNHIFYSGMITCFSLKRLSSGHHYKNFKMRYNKMQIMLVIYLILKIFNGGLMMVFLNQNM